MMPRQNRHSFHSFADPRLGPPGVGCPHVQPHWKYGFTLFSKSAYACPKRTILTRLCEWQHARLGNVQALVSVPPKPTDLPTNTTPTNLLPNSLRCLHLGLKIGC